MIVEIHPESSIVTMQSVLCCIVQVHKGTVRGHAKSRGSKGGQ